MWPQPQRGTLGRKKKNNDIVTGPINYTLSRRVSCTLSGECVVALFSLQCSFKCELREGGNERGFEVESRSIQPFSFFSHPSHPPTLRRSRDRSVTWMHRQACATRLRRFVFLFRVAFAPLFFFEFSPISPFVSVCIATNCPRSLWCPRRVLFRG